MTQFSQIRWKSKTRVAWSVLGGLIISAFIAAALWSELSTGDTPSKINSVQDQIDSMQAKESLNLDELYNLGSDLVRPNQSKAQAMILCRLNSKPDTFLSLYLWKDRISIATRPWRIYDPNAPFKAIGAGVASLALTIPAAWLTLTLFTVVWIFIVLCVRNAWCFLLNRIRELSNAVRGRPSPPSENEE